MDKYLRNSHKEEIKLFNPLTNEPINIRKATLEDSKKLSILYKQVYIQTYGIDGVSDEFANFITNQFSVSRIETVLKNCEECIIVAEYKNNLVGVLEIAYEKVCPINNIIAPELNKLYILEWFCGRGIGEMLLKESENILINQQIFQFWVWVLDSNTRAVNFYKKHDFNILGYSPFVMETNTYNNIVMLKNL